ncbi:L,D-transpeptidase [Rhodococcus sp. BP-349]|uniref:L,D-transpeptidase n=1 Tax=unclassified Rhodococcus (in: high G+C Gram-positive bacteria) TaxID=192944 RepID=UPI001C9A3B0A|nr:MULTISPECIES: Ig-like domain-containing protein [unclassified Rhodococcus (in: high G+C Gram-positive bacteria)]MBY6539642.1 L,D-transpeptidase [Rhodococcus sp. BP-363]MBY6544030.1 L,D-transpeptidase [Rhodococcus sp. BP-369]MBY6563260.1 L,D-transpeptidase [Rhodococcus sp. BP-370]MBY6577552.1 L,D-transpeptidase [Rhodococcus sp. BP-364]MBY6586853.1 L,D-transpeptidase [Rhodococcus sp. BP-358]
MQGRTPYAAVVAVLALVIALVAGCSGAPGSSESAAPTTEAAPVAAVTYAPAAGATDVSPTAPISVSVANGTFEAVSLTTADGRAVAGTLDPAKTTFTVTEPLGYDAVYTWAGTAVGSDGKPVPVEGTLGTVAPQSITSVSTNIGDGQEVGVAAPIILKFDDAIVDKKAVEKALTVTTNPPTAGSWAWLPDDGGSRVHWRPQNYWAPGTTVDVSAKLYGVNYGGGAYGDSDVTVKFTIGRSQVVVADATSHRMQVVRDGQTVMDIPVSYGEGNEDRNVTRSGIHVVTEKYEDFLMSNPPYYENVRERWATRISNNGEFIHANPLTTGVQGSSNVTNGCINLSTEDAQTYFQMAVYGDPVEVTGTRIDLSAADGDIYDWAIDWPTWQSMSALTAA